jgi:hypothetical protein
MLLQDALGGNTKTVMITCIPQHMRASGEISTALMWSARSRTIQNRAVRNIDSGGDSEFDGPVFCGFGQKRERGAAAGGIGRVDSFPVEGEADAID